MRSLPPLPQVWLGFRFDGSPDPSPDAVASPPRSSPRVATFPLQVPGCATGTFFCFLYLPRFSLAISPACIILASSRFIYAYSLPLVLQQRDREDGFRKGTIPRLEQLFPPLQPILLYPRRTDQRTQQPPTLWLSRQSGHQQPIPRFFTKQDTTHRHIPGRRAQCCFLDPFLAPTLEFRCATELQYCICAV